MNIFAILLQQRAGEEQVVIQMRVHRVQSIHTFLTNLLEFCNYMPLDDYAKSAQSLR